MREEELRALRRKIEAGDRLGDEEFAALDRLVASSPSRLHRLLLAHALMNAEEDRQALEQLRALGKDHPSDPEVRMATARALLGLERYADAEAEVKELLRQNPGDPEALKVLAALSLRHGETRRAKALVADALERDPFDGEARMLKEELEAADDALRRQPSPPIPLDELRDAVVTALRARGVQPVRRRHHLLLRSEQGPIVKVDLRTVHASLPPGLTAAELPAQAERIAAELQAVRDGRGLPTTRAELLARVLPLVRPAAGAKLEAGLYREGPAGLIVFYVLEDPDLVRYIPAGPAAALGAGLDALDDAAWQRLEAQPTDPVAVELDGDELASARAPTGLWALARSDGHDLARLLTAAQRERLDRTVGTGPWLVAALRPEFVLLCRLADPAAARLRALPGGLLLQLARDGALTKA